MAVYYKFKSAKDYDVIAIDGNFISVGHLKEKIFELKHLGRGTDFDLVVTNAQTNEEYLDEGVLIPKNTSVLIRRVPGRPRNPIVTAPVPEQEEPKVETYSDDLQAVKSSFGGAYQSSVKYSDDLEWDEFGNDLYVIPENVPVRSSNPVQNAPPTSKDDENSKIKALIDTPALDWQRQPADGFGPGRVFGRGMGGRMMGGRGLGRGGLEKKTPPQGYVCHRCKVPGHFIQHCLTNGDPNYDIKRVKPPTGIPKSMLLATPDGSYALPSGAVAVLKPNEAVFEKQIEGMPSLRSVGDFPPELHCPLCKEVMKDAVLSSKCCFTSFCDKCIRDYIISKSKCVCGATSILADDLLPNKTLRDTINRILESNNSSAENGGSAFQLQDMESRNPQAKVPSPTLSAPSKGQEVPAPPPPNEKSSKIADPVEEDKTANAPEKQDRTQKVPDFSEATHESKSIREVALPGNAQLGDEEVLQKTVLGEQGKKKKKKKIQMPNSASEMQWRSNQDLIPNNYMMPLGPSTFNPYWNSMQPGLDVCMPPYAPTMPYGGYGFSHMEMPFGGVLPQDPFGGPGCMLPYDHAPPQRDLSELAMGFNMRPPIMSREEFEARKTNLKQKRERERHKEMELSKDRQHGREANSSVDVPTLRSKSKSIPVPARTDNLTHHYGSGRPSPDRNTHDPELSHSSAKRKPEYDQPRQEDGRSSEFREASHHSQRNNRHRSSSSNRQRQSESPSEPPAASANHHDSMVDKKHKASVFSRISFPAEAAAAKKRKAPSLDSPRTGPSSHCASSNGCHEGHNKSISGSRKSSCTAGEVDSSDDERHFKRRPSRYTSTSLLADSAEPEGTRNSRVDRDRDRDGRYYKHR